MRDDVLIQAIDNTEDVMLHGAKWSEEAKQRVRQARRAGRRVSEMFGDLYKNSRLYINKAGKNLKRMANEIDSKYNISENNGRTRAGLKNATRYAKTAPLTNEGNVKTTRRSVAAKERQYKSVEARLKSAIPGYKDIYQRKEVKDTNKYLKKNGKIYGQRVDNRNHINSLREKVQERRTSGDYLNNPKRKYESSTNSYVTKNGNKTTYENAYGTVTIGPRESSKRRRRSR